MNELEKRIKLVEKSGFKAEVKPCPAWMKPYDQMLIVRLPSGFINDVHMFNSSTGKFQK